MNPIEERIHAGRALAVQRTKDIEPELSWFLASIRVGYDRTTGEPTSFSVTAHWRSWSRYCKEPFGDPSVEEIADLFTEWMRGAMERRMLVAEDPPMGGGPYPPHAKIKDLIRARLIELRGGEFTTEDTERKSTKDTKEHEEGYEAMPERVEADTMGVFGRLVTYTYDSSGTLIGIRE